MQPSVTEASRPLSSGDRSYGCLPTHHASLRTLMLAYLTTRLVSKPLPGSHAVLCRQDGCVYRPRPCRGQPLVTTMMAADELPQSNSGLEIILCFGRRDVRSCVGGDVLPWRDTANEHRWPGQLLLAQMLQPLTHTL